MTDPPDIGAARALGWLADRRSDVAAARAFYSMAVFVEGSDAASGRLEELGPAPPPTPAALSLGGPADHPEASSAAMPLRRSLAALTRRGGAGEAPEAAGPSADGTPTAAGPPAFEPGREDELRALAEVFGTPPFSLVAGAAASGGDPADGHDARRVAVVVLAAQPARIVVPRELLTLPVEEQTFLVARAFDRLRTGLALLDGAAGGTADDVSRLLDSGRAAIRQHEPAGVVGVAGVATEADLEAARALLPAWDTFRAAAERASDRFALLACRHPLAALRALYSDDAAAAAPGATELAERARRISFLRTGRGQDLLRYMASAAYTRAVSGEVDADDVDG
jgi:hypothetical protein